MKTVVDSPAISVIMPTFDRLEFLELTINALLAQSLEDWELIIADDGSSKSTLDYLESVAKSDQRVRLVRLEHSGNPSVTRNAGIALANAPLIAFLDSDDLWLPDKLSKQVAIMNTARQCGWSYTAFVTVDARGEALESERRRSWVPHEGYIFEATVRTTATIRTSCVVARTDLLRKVRGFDDSIDCGEDYDLWMRLALESEARVLDEPVVHYRRYPGNTSRETGHAHRARDYSLRKLTSLTTGAARTLVMHERSRNAVAMSAALAADGMRWQSLRAIGHSARFSWKYAHWWIGALKAAVRACAISRNHG